MCLHGHLPNDLARRLILAHALERGLADEFVRGPAAEMRLDHRFRLDPMNVAAACLCAGNFIKRRFIDLDCMQPLP